MKFLSTFCFVLFLLTSTTTAMELSSPAFNNGGLIPAKYTCNGENISPAIHWTGVPADAKSLVLIMDDPDAPMGTWDHWVVFNIPPDTTKFDENIKNYPKGTLLGQNSYKKNNYKGPCPPDKEHRYFFKLYALDILLNLPVGSSKAAVLNPLSGHILDQAQLMGRYNQPCPETQELELRERHLRERQSEENSKNPIRDKKR